MRRWNKVKVVALSGSVLVLLGLLIIMTGTTTSSGSVLPAFTPEQAARRQTLNTAGTCPLRMQMIPGSFRVEATQLWGGEGLVLSQIRCREHVGDPGILSYGTSHVAATWRGWQVTSYGAMMAPTPPLPGLSAGVSIKQAHLPAQQNSTLIYGRAFNENIHTVEVNFTDGTSEHLPLHAALFVGEVAGIVGVCDIRALDDEGQVINTIMLHGEPTGQTCP
jgi:hypothetical protein